MKKVLVDGYFVNNVGDDLFLKVLLERYPNVNFSLIVDKKFSDFYVYKNLTPIKKNFIIKIINRLQHIGIFSKITHLFLKKFSAYVEIGGSLFQQEKNLEGVSVKRNNIVSMGIPYYIIGSNFGPFVDKTYLYAYRKFFSEISGVSFRDSFSYKLFSDLPNSLVAPDVVFNLDDRRINKHFEKKPYIVLNPMNLANRDIGDEKVTLYENSIVKLGKYFLNKGFLVKIVCFNSYDGDLDVGRRIKKELCFSGEKDKVEIIPYKNLDEILSVLKGAEKLVSTRFHSMILGWLFQVPQVVVKYSSKVDNVINDLFPQQYNYDITSFSIKDFEKLDNKMNTISNSDLAVLRKEAATQFDQLDTFLTNYTPS